MSNLLKFRVNTRLLSVKFWCHGIKFDPGLEKKQNWGLKEEV